MAQPVVSPVQHIWHSWARHPALSTPPSIEGAGSLQGDFEMTTWPPAPTPPPATCPSPVLARRFHTGLLPVPVTRLGPVQLTAQDTALSFSAQNPVWETESLLSELTHPRPRLLLRPLPVGVPLAWKALCRVPAHVTHWLPVRLCVVSLLQRTARDYVPACAQAPHGHFHSSETGHSEAREQPSVVQKKKAADGRPGGAGSWGGGSPRLP